MRILLTGLNHRSAPLATREAVSLARSEVPAALVTLKSRAGHGVILSTCNRMEVYTSAPDSHRGREALMGFMEHQFGVSTDDLDPYLYTMEHDAAVEHLYRVASSLDSLIIGESEILGQVRDAYSMAAREGAAYGVLNHVFHHALRVGKRTRSETAIGRNALSVSRACVELTRRTVGDLRPLRVLLVGVGVAGRLAAGAFRDAGVGSLVVTNRTWAHAEELANDVGGEVAALDDLPDLLRQSDIVVCSTGAPDFIIGAELVRESAEARGGRPLFIIDVAVPRDVDPAAAEVPGVHLYTMYDLEMIAEANRLERESEASKAELIVQEEVGRFRAWWDARAVTPTIAGLRHRAEAIRAKEASRTVQRLPGLSPDAREGVEAMTKALVKKLLHDPTQVLRDRNDETLTQAARELFDLDDAD